MDSTMSALDDAIARTRRQIARDEAPIRRALWRAYRDALDTIVRDLELVTARLDGIPLPDSWFDARGRFTPLGEELFRQQRLRQLIPLVEAEMRRFADRGIRIIAEGQYAAVSGGAHAAVEMMGAAGVTATFGVGVNTLAVERLVSALQPGSPVRAVLDAYGDHAAAVIERELLTGVIAGKGPREVVETIRRELGAGTSRARLEALTRTEYMRAFNGSLDAQYQRMAHVNDGYRWSAAKSSRTCLACLSLDGRVFKTYQHQQHISCRCICTPVVRGVDIPYESGPAWFARQSAATQRAMMPSQRAYDAWKSGDVTLDDFRGTKRSRVWGTSYIQRSGAGALARAKGRRAA
jgi:SPP1 gp7 family putative phage head morphogenesis protein